MSTSSRFYSDGGSVANCTFCPWFLILHHLRGVLLSWAGTLISHFCSCRSLSPSWWPVCCDLVMYFCVFLWVMWKGLIWPSLNVFLLTLMFSIVRGCSSQRGFCVNWEEKRKRVSRNWRCCKSITSICDIKERKSESSVGLFHVIAVNLYMGNIFDTFFP